MPDVIHKYHLDLASRQALPLPPQAQPLSLQLQAGRITLWVKHTKDKFLLIPRLILCFPTGLEEIREPVGAHLGTLQLPDGTVWHFFFAE